MSRIEAYAGRAVVPGAAYGELLHADVGLSFMGGVDASTGQVIDTHHPLHGQTVAGVWRCPAVAAPLR